MRYRQQLQLITQTVNKKVNEMNTETNKPEIPEGWTEWVYNYDNPHPKNPNTLVNLLFRDGTSIIVATNKVSWCINDRDNFGNWKQIRDCEDIVAYKIAEDN